MAGRSDPNRETRRSYRVGTARERRAFRTAKVRALAKANLRKAGRQEKLSDVLEHEDLTGKIIGAAIVFVQDQIVVELKAIKELTPTHFAIVRSYLHAVGRNHGLILNFTKPKLDIKRVLASPSPD